MWEIVGTLGAKVLDLAGGIVNLLGKGKVDETERLKLLAEAQQQQVELQKLVAQLGFEIQKTYMESTANAAWRNVMIIVTGSTLNLMLLNNALVASYLPAGRELPWSSIGFVCAVLVLFVVGDAGPMAKMINWLTAKPTPPAQKPDVVVEIDSK